jgi:Segregation and condensation complex subunit ScpB
MGDGDSPTKMANHIRYSCHLPGRLDRRLERRRVDCATVPAPRLTNSRRALATVRQGGEPRCHRPIAGLNFIAAGPRSPQPGAPYTYVTTKQFLSHFGFDTLRDLPDMEALEDAGLLSKKRLLADDFPGATSEGADLKTIGEGSLKELETEEPPLALSSEDP